MKNGLLETLSVTNLNSTRKFPQNGIEVANYYFVSKVNVSLIQIEVLFSKKCPFGIPLKYHNFCSFPKYFQSRKGLSMLMPIFKVTGRAKSVWSILNFLKVTYARHTIAWRKPKLMQDLHLYVWLRFQEKDNCFYSAEVYISLLLSKYFVLYWKVA